uniref:Uncharacterized protein n=1 Tax=Eptatretus burgeri TaxID=7764 RepID=A0A8C4R9E8_EPTBU
MAVFLQFVMKQHDPVPLPVRSSFPEEIEMHLRPLSENHSDEDFLSAKEKTLKWATDIVIRQLEDYRKQRVMGLASIYGDHTLTEILQGSAREMTVASQLFKNIHNEM